MFWESFDGLKGVTYLYDTGTFYFKVSAANLDHWQITVEHLDQLDSSTYFSGTDSVNTATFTCSGHCVITWTTEYEDPEWALFTVNIEKMGEEIFWESFDGLNGTTHLYDEGTFYFDVGAANLERWEITVEDVTAPKTTPKTETTPKLTPETTTPVASEYLRLLFPLGGLCALVIIGIKRCR